MPPLPASRDLERPFVVRLAGLPASALEVLESTLPLAAASLRVAREELDQLRDRLIERLYGALLEHDKNDRRLLLEVKRRCHNRRAIHALRDNAGWALVDAATTGLADQVAERELEVEEALRQLTREHEEIRRVQAARLLAFAGHETLGRGVALSSPLLVSSTARLAAAPGKAERRKERKAEQSWLRYATRAAFKLSPYSTLSRMALGDVEPGSHGPRLAAGPWREISLLRAKRYMIEELRDLLFFCAPCRDLVPRRLNPSLEVLADGRIRFLTADRREVDREAGRQKYRQAAIVRAGLRPELLAALRRVLENEPLPLLRLRPAFAELVAAEDAGLPDQLVDLGLLLPVYPWPGNCTRLELELARYLGTFEGTAESRPEIAEIAALLLTVADLESGFAASPDPAGSIGQIHAALERAWELASELAQPGRGPIQRVTRDRSDLYEDVFVVAEDPAGQPLVRLGEEELRRLLAETRVFAELSEVFNLRHDFLHLLAKEARERFPDRDEVGVLELFAAVQPWWREFSRFISYGQTSFYKEDGLTRLFPESSDELRQLRRRMLAAIAAATRPGADGATIELAELEELAAGIPARYRSQVGGAFFVQPLAGDGPRWVLNRLFEGSGRYSSRYTALMPESLSRLYCERSAAGSRFELDGEPAELIDIACPQGDTLSVRKVLTPRVIECCGEHRVAPPELVLNAAQLRVRLGEVPTLRDADGLRLVPAHLGGVNLMFMPPLLKFLSLLGVGELRPMPWQRSPRERGEVQVFPRVVAGDVVLLRGRWRFPVAPLRAAIEAAGDETLAFLALDAWRAERLLPLQVFLIEPVSDAYGNPLHKPQYLDLSSPLCVELLRQVMAKGPEHLELEEVLPTPAMAPADAAGEAWAVELQLDALALGACGPRRDETSGAARETGLAIPART